MSEIFFAGLNVFALFLVVGLQCAPVSAASYELTTEYSSGNFFEQWDYSTLAEKNSGYVTYLSYADASARAMLRSGPDGSSIIQVENITTRQVGDDSFGRSSINMTSKETIDYGSLILFDATHVPFGCSVWPAFFTQGANAVWPSKGEIDIFENVNLVTQNQYSLHTTQGCMRPLTTTGSTGQAISADCYNNTNGNEGCIVKETKDNSFGSGFNGNGGGGYAATFDKDSIAMWFFPRASLPSDWTSNNPDPSQWGEPSTLFGSDACDIETFFGPQTMILTIDVCGAFAGSVFGQTGCTGQCVDVIGDPRNYDQAYFQINFIKTFSNSNATSAGQQSSSDSSGAPPSSTTSGGGSTGTGRASFSASLSLDGLFLALLMSLIATASSVILLS